MDDSTDKRELTLGEQAVGILFNPSDNPQVEALKKHYAAIIDILCPDGKLPDGTDMHGRITGRAVNDAIGAQMWAVKAATFKQ